QSVVGGAGAGRDGRDHWGGVFTTVLAGGGARGGVVHGSTDRSAATPATQPTPPADLAATVYHCLGVDPQTELHDRLGRALVLCEGTPIRAILSESGSQSVGVRFRGVTFSSADRLRPDDSGLSASVFR